MDSVAAKYLATALGWLLLHKALHYKSGNISGGMLIAAAGARSRGGGLRPGSSILPNPAGVVDCKCQIDRSIDTWWPAHTLGLVALCCRLVSVVTAAGDCCW